MGIENVLNNLRKVKKTGPGKWQALCPAHDDRSPSLSIKDDSGKILLHCFGGCEVGDVIGALGLDISELFPPRTEQYRPDETKHLKMASFTAMDALRCLHYEASVLAICAADMAEGKVLDEKERDRLGVSCGRIAAAIEYLEAN